MPKEKKKRGRRAEGKKRKLDSTTPVAAEENSNKRRRHSHDDPHNNDNEEPQVQQQHVSIDADQHGESDPHAVAGAYPHPGDMPFYGLLDEDEQEYFRSADEMLELNQFASLEDRDNFLNSIYKEAEGKELKMANSQSCSRLMERLIQLSSTSQLKGLFQKFSGHFLHLVQHRFASHCCEALFIQAAPIVTTEIKSPPQPNLDDPNEVIVTMEDLFLHTLHELDTYLGYLTMDKFASHTLRVLLTVLSGQSLSRSDKVSVLHSKKKEHISVVHAAEEEKKGLDKRAVPESFTVELEKFVSQSVSGFDTPFLQSLSMHQTANPTLQLLLQLELTVFGKQKAKDQNSIIHKLLPDDPITEDSPSGGFINGCVYDPLGSRLLETIIKYAPGKLFKSIYRTFFKDRIAVLARNDVASYIVCALLTRLGKEDLKEASDLLVAQMQTLVDRNRTVVIKTLIERCSIRGVDPAPIADALAKAYGGPNGFDITKLLKLSNSTADSPALDSANDKPSKAQHASEKLHGSLLAQAMLAAPGELGSLILDSLPRLGTSLLIQIAKDPTASRTLQAALMSPGATVIARRKIIQMLYGHVGEMALDPSASHVIDAIWTGTHGLAFIRERIAEELAETEAAMRESHVGRAVWRNWKMDLYKRRRKDWVAESRASAGRDSFLPFPEEGEVENGTGDETERERGRGSKHMTALDRARLKHAEAKAKAEKKDKDKDAGNDLRKDKGKQKGKRERDDDEDDDANDGNGGVEVPREEEEGGGGGDEQQQHQRNDKSKKSKKKSNKKRKSEAGD